MRIDLDKLLRRLVLTLVVAAACAVLTVVIVERYTVGTLADYRLQVGRDMLLVPTEYLPDSPRLNARLAEAEMVEGDRDLARAEYHARRAIEFSPYDFRNRVALASVKEAQGDRAAAERALGEARRLAPYDRRTVRWRLANLLLREGKFNDSLPEFREAIAGNVAFLPVALDLVWRASRENVAAIQTITPDEPRAQLLLAQFLIKQSRFFEAAAAFESVDRQAKLSAAETPAVINGLIFAGRFDVARGLWLSLLSHKDSATLVWNGGFEAEIVKTLAQFDWSLTKSEYAKPAIDPSTAHTGSRSLRIEFLGRDTTALDNEVRQLVVVRPGRTYRLECWVRSSNLTTPEGPKVVVSDAASSNWLASSLPIAAGSSDWQRVELEFAAPGANSAGEAAIYLSIKRKPKFSYDEPTKGMLWFDDFTLTQRQ